MRNRAFIGVVFVAMFVFGAAFGAVAQERTKPKGPADFVPVHAAVAEHWNASHWGKCFASVRELTAIVSERRADAIRAAMPAAPAGYELVEKKGADRAQASSAFAGLAAAAGNAIEQVYRSEKKEVKVHVTADSPMATMFQSLAQNPSMLKEKQELVTYTECKAVLEARGPDTSLRFVLGDSMVEATFRGESAEFALKMLDQAAVTKLHQAIMN